MHINKKKILLIDGYNIINSWQDLSELASYDLDEAREVLIDYMSELQSMIGDKVIVVFDAYMKKGSIGKLEIRKNIEIVFTKEFETADNYIEKKVANSKKFEEYRVASSDSIIQNIILGQGATRISAQELLLIYKNNKNNLNEGIKQQKKSRNTNIVKINSESLNQLYEKFKKNQ